MSTASGAETDEALAAAVGVVTAYVAENTLPADRLPDLIQAIHATFAGLGQADAAPAAEEKRKPAVPISRSVTPDYIVCLEDGARLKMLKRYIGTRFNLTPDDYRRKWGLPDDYPMVAPAYAAKRSAYAKQIGLGRGVRRK